MSKLQLDKRYVHEMLSVTNIGLKLTEIGLQTNKTADKVVTYFIKVMDSMEKLTQEHEEQTE